MSDLVGIPKDLFSRVVAHFVHMSDWCFLESTSYRFCTKQSFRLYEPQRKKIGLQCLCFLHRHKSDFLVMLLVSLVPCKLISVFFSLPGNICIIILVV